ncbi:MAG: hypothetical protein E6Q97_24955 [Desulfurellales bacterium]|nr:MAG: hypothetical protein E6Q97_24955 [Desulfurellales bacterium]
MSFWSEGFWSAGFWSTGFWGATDEPSPSPLPYEYDSEFVQDLSLEDFITTTDQASFLSCRADQIMIFGDGIAQIVAKEAGRELTFVQTEAFK